MVTEKSKTHLPTFQTYIALLSNFSFSTAPLSLSLSPLPPPPPVMCGVYVVYTIGCLLLSPCLVPLESFKLGTHWLTASSQRYPPVSSPTPFSKALGFWSDCDHTCLVCGCWDPHSSLHTNTASMFSHAPISPAHPSHAPHHPACTAVSGVYSPLPCKPRRS